MHNMLNFINIIYKVYFLVALICFVLMAILNFKALQKLSTAKLILLYIALPALYFRSFAEWIIKFIRKGN